jgi:uncharacterized repeat protein (TIGR01451 family)
MKIKIPPIFLVLALSLLLLTFVPWSLVAATPSVVVQAPSLKWQHGGCYNSWCETGWYSSPAVADLDGDGTMEVIGATYSLFVLNGENGSVQWSVDPEGGRVWPGVVVADIDDDSDLEVVTAHGSGYLHVFDHLGNTVWTQRPSNRELRGLSAYDLDSDGTLEIIVTGAVGSETNTWVYEHDSTPRPGWPQLSNDSGYAWGVFNDNVAVGDLDGDDVGELIVPSDVHYINAYEENGAQIPAHPLYGDNGWGKVGIWESLEVELRGWGQCNGERAESYRTNFADGASVMADVNVDGAMEVVVTGNVYDCHAGYPPSRYNGVYIFNADRSRFNEDGFDWRTVPVDTGAPLSEDYSVIESDMPNPVVADLDGDSMQEILYSAYDGRVHAFWLDKTEHHQWPYEVTDASEGFYRFASEPVVADLDNNGQAEVLFASWVQKGTNQTGKLHILDYQGNVLHQVALPVAFGSPNWNGALAAPTLANIDSDADLEVVLNTAHSGLVAYDLPGTAEARLLWATGRGNYQRTGSFLQGTLQASAKHVSSVVAEPGQILTYTIQLQNPGPDLSAVHVTDTLPAQVTYGGRLWASAGTYGQAGGVITWTGTVPAATPVTIGYTAVISDQITGPQVVVNTALLDDGLGNSWSPQATVIVNGQAVYLPFTSRR